LTNVTLEIYDIKGQKVRSETIYDNTTRLEMASFKSGVYTYRLVDNGKLRTTGKFILTD